MSTTSSTASSSAQPSRRERREQAHAYLTRLVGEVTHNLMGLIVNLADYNVGADKGGAVNLFDDFDIDYNAQKYLIETRCSGALVTPYSAIAIEYKTVGA